MVQYELTNGGMQAALKYCNKEDGLLKVDRSKFQISTFSKIEEIIPHRKTGARMIRLNVSRRMMQMSNL